MSRIEIKVFRLYRIEKFDLNFARKTDTCKPPKCIAIDGVAYKSVAGSHCEGQ